MHRDAARIARRTWRKWRDDGGTRQGAGLAFYALFSLAPLLVISAWVFDAVLGELAIVDLRAAQLGALLPEALVDTTEELVETTAAAGSRRSIALAIFALVYAPVRGFLQLQATLNDSWGVRAVRGPGPLQMIRRKGLAFASVGTTLALLFVGVGLNALLLAAGERVRALVDPPGALLAVTDWIGSLVLIFLLLAILFKTLADVVIAWRDALAGAALTALLLIVGREVIAAYLAASTRTLAFGAAGSLVAILLFAYYACQVVMFGAAFTWVFADERGAPIQPGRDAVRVLRTRAES